MIDTLSTYSESLSIGDRFSILRDAANALSEQELQFATLISYESGMALADARREINRSVTNLLVASEETRRLFGESIPVTYNNRSFLATTQFKPIGVVYACTPFNRPVNQVVVKVAPALVANSPILVKPSEKTPLSAIRFVNLLRQVGLPLNFIQVATGDPKVITSAALSDSRVKFFAFTGSATTADAVAPLVGRRRSMFELGGNCALIVLNDANISDAAAAVAAGAFACSGQSCRAVKRVVISSQIAPVFKKILIDHAAKLVVGDPIASTTDIGSLINEAAACEVENACKIAVAGGAAILVGGRRHGPFFPPTIIDHVQATSELAMNEVFGPVVSIIYAETDEEAINVANSSKHGLHASVYTSSLDRFNAIASQLNFGAVMLNESTSFDSPYVPFGGIKDSGHGREGIRFAAREMCATHMTVVPAV